MKQLFVTQVANYCDAAMAETLWNEIETAYTNEERYFHNLFHLEHLLHELTAIKEQINDWDTLFFSLVYHDLAYNVEHYVVQGDNEERSAETAQQRLESIGYPAEKIKNCCAQILATKLHLSSADSDTNYFTDADLAILGTVPKIYDAYKRNIRREFIIYPDPIYQAGRIKVLNHFLNMPRIYKTAHFHSLYEEQARENLLHEKELLSVLSKGMV